MKLKPDSVVYRFLNDESGQVLPWVVILIIFLFAGLSALVVDVGRAVVAYHMLQASSDAAALAGVEIMPTATAASTVTTQATLFSSVPGNKNASSLLPNAAMVSGYPKLYCSTTVTSLGATCTSALGANAIVVSQTLNLPMFFGSIIGVPTMTITATSTAGMRGAQTAPYNIAVVIDTTASMNQADSSTICTSARITCALQGVQKLLNGLSPCTSASASSTCVGYDTVSLFTYPNITASTAHYDSDCSTANPTVVPYSTPVPGATWTPTDFSSASPTYQVTNYLDDWSSNNTEIGKTGSFSNTSLLTRAVGASKSSGCSATTGMQAVGGEGTYYAGAIYAAASSLAYQQSLNPSSKNALIILSDGDANAKSGHMTATNGETLTTTGVYPSLTDQCHQAITAAQSAAALTDSSGNPDTTVYTIAYGASTSTSGSSASCTTDSPKISACSTLQQMASSSSTFYSTDGSTSGCESSNSYDDLNSIFGNIVANFTRARLLPNGTP